MSNKPMAFGMACIVLVSALLSGCIINASTDRRHDGSIPSGETLAQIEEGKTTVAWLLACAGTPSSRTRVDDHTELLRYERVDKVDCTMQFLFVANTRNEKRTRETVVFEAVDDVIQRYWAESAALTVSNKCH